MLWRSASKRQVPLLLLRQVELPDVSEVVHALRVHDVLEVRRPSTSAQVLSYKVCLQQVIYEKKCIKVRTLETVNKNKRTKKQHTRTKSTRTSQPVASTVHTCEVTAYAEVNGRDNEVRLKIPASDKCFTSVSLETYLVKMSAGLSVPSTFLTAITPEVISS